MVELRFNYLLQNEHAEYNIHHCLLALDVEIVQNQLLKLFP